MLCRASGARSVQPRLAAVNSLPCVPRQSPPFPNNKIATISSPKLGEQHVETSGGQARAVVDSMTVSPCFAAVLAAEF